jgi:hypothetical protein
MTHRTVLAIFTTVLAIAVIAAFLTTLNNVDTRSANIEAPPGTIGMARTDRQLVRRTTVVQRNEVMPGLLQPSALFLRSESHRLPGDMR